ncbi:MAG: hypothetical protein JRD89_15255 [Deltaproteobacteria bacterium]|nr:hypothetical protein [Deltaproteobacteria bacterium]
MLIAVKREVLEELLRDPEFSERLERCGSLEEVAGLLREYAERKGFRVAEV